jgi:hypothetical protein
MFCGRIGLLISTIVIVALVAVCPPAATGQAPAAPPARVQDARLGTATHFQQGWDHEAIMPLIAQAGLTWIRDELLWSNVEKTKGVYQIPEKERRWIRAAHQHNLKLILVLNFSNPLYEDPYDPEAFALFAAEMARQLKDDVDCLEILNEPANFGYSKVYGGTWNGVEKDRSVSPWVGKYVTLINKAAPAIKSANPKMKVIGLGSQSPVNFRQLAMGISPAVDGIVDHPYSYKSVPEIIPFGANAGILDRDGIAVADEQGTFTSLIRNYRSQSLKYDGPKEIWLTEWGYTTFQPAGPTLFAGFTRSAQAKYLLRRFVECLALGVDVIIQYDFKDDGSDIRETEHHFGLVDAKLQPKPSYEAISHLTQATAPLRADASVRVTVFPVTDQKDAIPAYGFRDAAGHAVLALWSAERVDGDLSPRTADVELLSDQPVSQIHCLDVLNGKRSKIAFKQEDGTVMMEALTIPDSPIFLTVE